jgi:hypothetical protein
MIWAPEFGTLLRQSLDPNGGQSSRGAQIRTAAPSVNNERPTLLRASFM